MCCNGYTICRANTVGRWFSPGGDVAAHFSSRLRGELDAVVAGRAPENIVSGQGRLHSRDGSLQKEIRLFIIDSLILLKSIMDMNILTKFALV